MSAETVVLLHGIWMPGSTLFLLKKRLEADGRFEGRIFSYPSVPRTLDDNAHALFAFVQGAERVHLLGHSLGGVVALRMLALHPEAPPGRVVCLGSPLTGSRPAEVMVRNRLGRRMIGNTLRDGVVERPASEWATPVTDTREVGIIAGTKPLGIGRIVTAFDGPSDGTVAVDETRLPGAHDHLCLPVTHTTLATSQAVADQVDAFLRRGEFLRE